MTVTDPPIEVFHPRFQRQRGHIAQCPLDPGRHLVHSIGQGLITWLHILHHSLKVEHRSGDLHPKLCWWHGCFVVGNRCGFDQNHTQCPCIGQYFGQGVGYQCELIEHLPRFGEVTPRQQGPALFGGTDALAGLQQQCRVKTPQRGLVIVERHHGTQANRQTHRIQPRCRHICTTLCIRRKKQRLFSQLTRNILLALDMGRIFRQQA